MLEKIEFRRRGQQRMRWLFTNLIYMNFSKLWEMMKKREAWCPGVHGVANSQIRLSH